MENSIIEYNRQNEEFLYKNYIIDASRAYRNIILVFDEMDGFYGEYKYIIEVKNLINKNKLIKLN